MGLWPERSLRALTVYYERGQKALLELRCERYDEADAMLTKRKAAFHNFRAADFIAEQEGYPPSVAQALDELWKNLVILDRELMHELQGAKGKLEGQLTQLAKARATLGRFKSSELDEKKFEKSV